jgi:hypothetical protein
VTILEKTKILRWAVVLVALDIATICIICGIYASFVQTSTTNEITTLEKWGVKISAPASTLEKSYSSQDGKTLTLHSDSAYGDIVAPGSNYNLGHFTITGTEHSDIAVTCRSNLSFDENWRLEDGYTQYCPIVFTVGNDKYKVGDITSEADNTHVYATIDELEKAVKNAIESMYTQNGEYHMLSDGTWEITYGNVEWEWDFYKDDTYDSYDTMLGNSDPLPTFAIDISLTLEWDEDKTTPPSVQTELASADNTSDNTQEQHEVIDDEEIALARTARSTDSLDTIEPSDIPQSHSLPITGDTFRLIFWVSLMVVSATVIIVMLVMLVKRRKGQPYEKENNNNTANRGTPRNKST